MKIIHIGCILSCCFTTGLACAEEGKGPATEQAEVAENLTAEQILSACTKIIPTEPLLLKGALTVRKLRGIVLDEYPFKLLLDWGAKTPTAECLLLDPQGTSLVERAVLTRPAGKPAQIKLYSGPQQTPEVSPAYSGRIRGTDMTWMDLTLDFLWWKELSMTYSKRRKTSLKL